MDKDLKNYYFKFKESKYYLLVVYLGTIVISCILIIVVIIPLIQSALDINQQVNAVQQQVNTLKANIRYLGSLNDERLDHDLDLANQAVLQTKDFSSI